MISVFIVLQQGQLCRKDVNGISPHTDFHIWTKDVCSKLFLPCRGPAICHPYTCSWSTDDCKTAPTWPPRETIETTYTGVPKVRPPRKTFARMFDFGTNLYNNTYTIKSEKFYFMFVWRYRQMQSTICSEITKWLRDGCNAPSERDVLVIRSPLFHCLGRTGHWKNIYNTDDLAQNLTPFTFMGYQTKFWEYFPVFISYKFQ